MKFYEKEIDIENEKRFKKLIDMYKDSGKCLGDILLNFESVHVDVMVYYLNIDMTNFATVNIKFIMTYRKLSSVVTFFEEAFAILVMESNFIDGSIVQRKRLLRTMH